MQQETPQRHFKCPKCSCTQHEQGELRAAGGMLSKIFDVQNQKYACITCKQCRYTEFYKAAKSGTLGNIFDLFTG